MIGVIEMKCPDDLEPERAIIFQIELERLPLGQNGPDYGGYGKDDEKKDSKFYR